jgi:signal transduction histidine kinase
LDTVAKVRALSPAEAAKGLPVRIEATVIYYDPVHWNLFVQDETASTYVSIHTREPTIELRSLSLAPGMRVRLEATTQVGGFFPDLMLERLTRLGQGALPPPRQIDENELLSPALDSQWVEVPALVTGVESDPTMYTLVVEVHGWKLKAVLPPDEHSAERSAELMQRPVRLQGIAGTNFNHLQRQMTGRYFYVPSFDQIIPADSPIPDAPLPLRKISELLHSDDTTHTLVRVQGVVTQLDGNNFYLRDPNGSMQVDSSGKDSFLPGDRVEVEGFAVIAPFRPIFRARKVSVAGRNEPTRPVPFDLRVINAGDIADFQAELVELDAEFLSRHEANNDVLLQCRIGDHYFEAFLARDGLLPERPTPGDQVRLTGICKATSSHPLAMFYNADGFRIHLPKTGGVLILRHAAWWTLQRVLIILGIVSGLALVVLAWAWLLRNRVKAQTEIIGSQLQREAVHDERQRIARELHDTVEQELSGLAIQLGSISDDIEETPDEVPPRIHTAIQNAQKVLRHCREEARSSIRDLRSIQLEQRGLAGALRQLLPVTAAKGGAEFQIQVSGDPRPLPAMVEAHLLRIAQEAVGNAVKHATARTITTNLDYTLDAVTLAIHDDGCGFDRSAPPPDGHFGLLGMQERGNKMQAVFEIESAPGKGTSIWIMVPLLDNPETKLDR